MLLLRNKLRLHESPLLLVLGVGLLHLWIVWPGFWTPDTHTQYAMALRGLYSDHHPPMMSWVWHYLNKLEPGSGLLLGLHLSFLYAAVFYFMKSFAQQKIRFAFLLLPFIPQIFIYAGFIWKDVGFAFSFLCCAAYLSYITSMQKPLPWYALISIFLILLYGTALKFQAQYCAPILLLWIAHSFARYEINFKRFVPIFCALSFVFYGSLKSFNDYWVPEKQRNYSWQYVKIYDLAAISIHSGVMFLPDCIKNENFSDKALHDTFYRNGIPVSVDELVFGAKAILRKGNNPVERTLIYKAWVRGLMSYPRIYLRHRANNMAYALLSRPGFMYVPQVLSHLSTPETPLYRVLYASLGILFYVLMSHMNAAILCLVYLAYSVKMQARSWAAMPLLYLNAIGLSVLGILFFCSMAGTPRYTYILVCMVHASHVFAYHCYRAKPLKKLGFF
ncbi:MAG: hypothetical protein KA508_03040 [Gammaproteobacteria bacterium]|nr:hypothetical protein [Gammaproteobacteria bacterium]